jgi:hypothetical protein
MNLQSKLEELESVQGSSGFCSESKSERETRDHVRLCLEVVSELEIDFIEALETGKSSLADEKAVVVAHHTGLPVIRSIQNGPFQDSCSWEAVKQRLVQAEVTIP